ncbi:MAG: cobalamin-dependent protein [Parcubacteria group bacterium]
MKGFKKVSDDQKVRFIVPALLVNVFSIVKIPPLGPVLLASIIFKMFGMDVEIIDENNYSGPVDKDGLPDHHQLQRDDHAAVVCIYCGMTGTMKRAYELASYYYGRGVLTIAGGAHTNMSSEEALDNGFAIVVHGDGEETLVSVFKALMFDGNLTGIPGISYIYDGIVKMRNGEKSVWFWNLDEEPLPRFELFRHLKKPWDILPAVLSRGCAKCCSFCSVHCPPRPYSPEYFLRYIQYCTEKYRVKKFFIVDDWLNGFWQNATEAFKLITQEFGDSLRFTVQIELKTADNVEFLEAMYAAGVRTVCVGMESPVQEDLDAANKKIEAGSMVSQALVLRKYFWLHAMLIWGLPNDGPTMLSVGEKIRRFQKLLLETKSCSTQIFPPIPFVGTKMYKDLDAQGRIFPLDVVPWNRKDGTAACFIPTDMTIRELHETPTNLMKWFYREASLYSAFPETPDGSNRFLSRKNWEEFQTLLLLRIKSEFIIRAWDKQNDKDCGYVERLEKFVRDNRRAS